VLRQIAIAALVSAPFSLAAQTAASPSAERSVSGSYTEAQAALGKTAYETSCASCHATSFHTDEQFRFNWFGRTVLDLFRTLKSTMPEDNPGGLSDDDYTRVIAYILKLNGFQPGADSLTSDSTSMRLIRIRAAADTAAKHPGR
jgi:mono/diheme cytochrome c family protein